MKQNFDKEQVVESLMAHYTPEDITIIEGAYTYHSTVKTHQSYYAQWSEAIPNSWTRKVYMERCYDWLLLLKKRGVAMKKNELGNS